MTNRTLPIKIWNGSMVYQHCPSPEQNQETRNGRIGRILIPLLHHVWHIPIAVDVYQYNTLEDSPGEIKTFLAPRYHAPSTKTSLRPSDLLASSGRGRESCHRRITLDPRDHGQ